MPRRGTAYSTSLNVSVTGCACGFRAASFCSTESLEPPEADQMSVGPASSPSPEGRVSPSSEALSVPSHFCCRSYQHGNQWGTRIET